MSALTQPERPARNAGRHALLVIALTVFLDLLGFGMVIPILQLYARDLGVPWPRTGWLISAYSVMQLFFAPIWGRLSDRVGRRPVLLLSIFGSCASQVGYALATTFPGLLVARAITGICGANIAAAQAYVADITDERSRAGAMGVVGSALGLGFVFGPFIGGELARYSLRTPFLCAAALSGLNFVLAYFLVKEPTGHRHEAQVLTLRGLAQVLSSPRLLALMALYFTVTFGFSVMEGTLSPLCAVRFGYGREQVGRLFALCGVVLIIVQGRLVKRLVPRTGERPLVLTGVALMGGGFALIAVATALKTLIVGMILMAAGSGLNNPSLTALLSKNAHGHQGGVLGVAQSLGSMGRILGPLLGTAVFVRGTDQPFWLAALCMALALPIAALSVKRRHAGPPEALMTSDVL